MTVRRPTFVCALLAVSLLSAPAVAGPSPAEKETARGLVRSGRVKKKQGDIQGALEDFQAAHAIMDVPTTGIELAKAQVSAGYLVEALDTVLGVGRIPKKRFEPAPFRKARKEAAELAEELPPKIPAVVIEVSGDGADEAVVTIDDAEQNSAVLGAPIKLNPGSHEIVAKTSDGAEARDDVSLQEGMTREVSLVLVRPEEPAPTPSTEPETTTNPALWVGLGLAGAGGIVGAVTGSLAMAKYADVAPSCPDNQCPPDVHGDLDSGKTLGTVATVSFIVAGVGAATAITAFFFPLEADDEEPSSEIGIGPGFVTWRGQF